MQHERSEKAVRTEERYRGVIASEYEQRRSQKPKWKAETAVITDMLKDKPAGTEVLDIPVGTGRFLPLYDELGFDMIGMDINEEMLAEARKKGMHDLRCGDILNIDLPDDSVDLALAIRIVNLIRPPDMQRALRELQRVSRFEVIFNVRTGDVRPGHFHDPQNIEDIEAALLPGWYIAENREIHEPDFRMIRLAVD
jgi:ubiquinone/menaquinone biosynthesis C-methylase UbiE